jgi:hypothetical protein
MFDTNLLKCMLIEEETYSAFCRKHGDYSTAAVGPRNWNAEMTEAMTKDLGPRWRELCLSLTEQYESLVSIISELMSWATQYLGIRIRSFHHVILLTSFR